MLNKRSFVSLASANFHMVCSSLVCAMFFFKVIYTCISYVKGAMHVSHLTCILCDTCFDLHANNSIHRCFYLELQTCKVTFTNAKCIAQPILHLICCRPTATGKLLPHIYQDQFSTMYVLTLGDNTWNQGVFTVMLILTGYTVHCKKKYIYILLQD